jgi:exonuclease III
MDDENFHLISWNIGGRGKKNPDQIEPLRERQPDVIALQEVTLNALNNFKKLVLSLGLRQIVESVELPSSPYCAQGGPDLSHL